MGTVEAGSSKPKTTLRVHVQTQSSGLSEKQAYPLQLTDPDELIYVNAQPEVSELDVKAIDSWPSDGGENALRLTLTPRGTRALQAATIQNIGKVLVVFLNGRIAYAATIDQQIADGVLIVPRGVLSQEIEHFQAQLKSK